MTTPAPPATENTAKSSHITVTRRGDLAHVTFATGRADGTAVRQLYEAAARIIDSADIRFLIDFSGLPIANSGAMGMMVTIKKRAMSRGAQLHLAIPDPNIRQSFEHMNLHLILNIFPSVDEAIDSFKP